MNDEENNDAENLANKGKESYKAKNYERTMKHYEDIKLDPMEYKNVSDFCEWGKAILGLAEIRQDEALFEYGFEKYETAATLEKLDKEKASILYAWGNGLSSLAEIKPDETIFNRTFEKYKQATEFNPNCDLAYCNWGIALYRWAIIKKDETTFEKAFKKYEKAIDINSSNAKAYYNWGITLYRKARIKQKEDLIKKAELKKHKMAMEELDRASKSSLFKSALEKYYETENSKPNEELIEMFKQPFEKYDKAIRLNPSNALASLAYCNWGIAIFRLAEEKKEADLFESAFQKYKEAIKLDPKNTSVYFYWGVALYGLAKITRNEAFKKNLEDFEKETEKVKEPDTLLIKGELYFILYQSEKNKEYEEKVKKYFKESKKDILEILTFLDEDNEKDLIDKDLKDTDFLRSLLSSDNKDSKDSTFFQKTTENVEQKYLDEYKKIYILSNFIISRLYISNQNEKYEKYEKFVAHYREKEVSQRLLFEKDFKFRLNTIDYSNDKKEGKNLLEFLYREKCPSDEKLSKEEYEAFGSCFTFDYDSLNQFRLYGKEEGREGTGLSLVFRDSFFNKEAKMDFESPKKDSLKMEMDDSINEDKSALFRCIYIDPDPEVKQSIVSVGQKEKISFHKEKLGDKFEFYSNEIEKIIECVREKMNELKEQAKTLDPDVVGQLLIKLRYLVKHISFKDEQECRIVKIRRLKTKHNDDEIKNDSKRLYIEYQPKVSNHLERIIFGPKATGFESFKNMLKNKKLEITCERSKNTLA